MTDKVKVTQHLCITEAGCCVVPETNPLARWLHWPTGTEVDAAEYERLTTCPKHRPKLKGRHAKLRTPQENK